MVVLAVVILLISSPKDSPITYFNQCFIKSSLCEVNSHLVEANGNFALGLVSHKFQRVSMCRSYASQHIGQLLSKTMKVTQTEIISTSFHQLSCCFLFVLVFFYSNDHQNCLQSTLTSVLKLLVKCFL